MRRPILRRRHPPQGSRRVLRHRGLAGDGPWDDSDDLEFDRLDDGLLTGTAPFDPSDIKAG